jgi:deazaflavin-dependent oxidoreductase (nitroreductase family)
LSHAIGRFNRVATNRLTSLVAGRLPGFGIITHRGRRSGRTYRTPVNVFRRPGGFVVALTYGRGDWVKNVLAAGQAQVHTRGRAHSLSNPRVLRDPARTGLPASVRGILRLLNVDEFLWLDEPSSKTSRARDGRRRQRIRFGRLLDRAVHRRGRPAPSCDDGCSTTGHDP